MPEWRIYYSDSSTFDDSDGWPDEAPGWSVQIIASTSEELGRRVECKSDYYIYYNGEWIGLDFVGLMDHLVNELGVVKVGRMLPKEQFRKVYDQALNDPDFPPKSAWDQREYRLE